MGGGGVIGLATARPADGQQVHQRNRDVSALLGPKNRGALRDGPGRSPVDDWMGPSRWVAKRQQTESIPALLYSKKVVQTGSAPSEGHTGPCVSRTYSA